MSYKNQNLGHTVFTQALLAIQDWDGEDIEELKKRVEFAASMLDGEMERINRFYKQIRNNPRKPPEYILHITMRVICAIDRYGACLFEDVSGWKTANLDDLVFDCVLIHSGKSLDEIKKRYLQLNGGE